MGRYARSVLAADEAVLYEAKLHRAIFVGPALVLLFACVQPVLFWLMDVDWGGGQVVLSATLLFIGGCAMASALIRRATGEFVLTDRRLIVKTGLVALRASEMALSRVETLTVRQGLVARLLNSGTLEVRGVGGSPLTLAGIADPLAMKRAVEEAVAAGRRRGPFPFHEQGGFHSAAGRFR